MEEMHAVIYKGPGDYALEKMPVPSISDDEILVKVDAVGLCGSDLRTLKFGHRKVTPPFILGHEISGTIQATGALVDPRWAPGMRLALAPVVYCGTCHFCRRGQFELCQNYREIGQTWSGGFADYIALPQEALQHGVIHPIPQGLDAIPAALAEPLAACLHALDLVDFRNVHSAAIFGSGAIGCLLLQLLRNQGLHSIIIIDPNETRLQIAGHFHPDHRINAADEDSVERIRILTKDLGVDLIFTATAAPIAQQQALESISKGGQIVVFAGLPKGQSVIPFDLNKVHYDCIRLIGSSIYAPHHHQQALRSIAEGHIDVEHIITTYPLVEFQRGVQAAMSGKIIKAVFTP
ncbi:MAG: alcohol dehydrogenase catalytic domain-containing protein [Chloroflexi bacterium]|nr:alcohol dehydrogenase catalytic domain-containing protein [Chloroflexota bacterium]